ncbi:lytic polysaccharide monooxygenase [Aaosphaeria arxii CBS 175.79]|uniref:AA9 family lytic polysaccharide monooxygenase n=1 Tax=Aaosphaeria arxii CBS 175.79 TaxID=1450172 RepID=A0A6A5X8R1_9PLEO|nr:lytic polysaccharide monooxygenase [Aaosphaeria arxii CBS 175.79]KAF2009342.1 lytic polysaccharide monooxygenase [Aaosphaeria arxii CBS 175.79]
MKLTTNLTLAVAASTASAHTIFVSLNGGKVGDGVRVPSYDGPITEVTSNDIVCNGGPNPTKSTSTVINVQAGSTAKLTWRHTLTSGPNDVIDASHKGPVMAYLKKVSDATKDSGVGGGWFKIAEDGFDGSKWGVDRLIANQGEQTVTIPSCIAPGQYLLRGELIALHGAQSPKGAQFYMECAQINIQGGSASKTPSSVSLPGAYSASDSGILFNLYSGKTSYKAPGPAVFKC